MTCRAALLLVLAVGCSRQATTTAPEPATPAPSSSPAVSEVADHSQAVDAASVASIPTPSIEPPWREGDVARIQAVAPLVERAAARHGLDVGILDAIIWHESRFEPKARGPGGAAGLMQLMPSTSRGLAKRMGVAHEPLDPTFNVDAGALLLSRLLDIFDGDLELALAGYALGHGAVKQRLAAGEPLPERTLRFVAKVRGWAPAFAELHAGAETPGARPAVVRHTSPAR